MCIISGDFRYTPSMLREQCLRNNTTIDVLYLDNTNCDPTRAVPSRQRATQQIKEIIRAHSGYAVVIGKTHTFNIKEFQRCHGEEIFTPVYKLATTPVLQITL